MVPPDAAGPPESTWTRIARALPPSPPEQREAEALAAELAARGHVRRTCRQLLELSDGVAIALYARLAAAGPPAAPADGRADSGWMADADFCYVHARATGLGSDPGNLVQAAKLLPGLRASAIHLGPFLDYAWGCIYIPRAERTLSPRLVHPALAAAGFGAEAQLLAFVEACHLLGRAVGFDLQPQEAQFSRGVLAHPRLFRWIALGPDRALEDGRTMGEMMAGDVQEAIAGRVEALVRAALAAEGVAGLEHEEADTAAARSARDAAFARATRALIAAGLWTVPVQAWDGLGVPAFCGYHREGEYPLFDFRSAGGQDRNAGALTAVTPIKMAGGLPPNRAPRAGEAYHVDAGAEHLAGLFRHFRDRYGFDFVRCDAVDHVLDAVGRDGLPVADRPTPRGLKLATARAREGRPGTGALAARAGDEIGEYADLGFDLTLGDAMTQRIDRGALERAFALQERLAALNRGRAARASVCFAVDTHDSGDPRLWGEPLVRRMGFDRMLLRQFVARFAACGPGRRPKYEVMGAQDLSHGLFRASVSEENLEWVGDAGFNAWYHAIEDAWELHRDLLARGSLVEVRVAARVAWWVVSDGQDHLLALTSLETAEGWDCGGFSLAPRGLDLSAAREHPVCPKRAVTRVDGARIFVEHLEYLGLRLWSTRAPARP